MRTQAVAVDWSGKEKGESEFIWLARVKEGVLVELENARSREQTVARLAELGQEQERTAIGLDFAFSFPVWYLDERGWDSAGDAWSELGTEAEAILRDCPPPFWGRPQRRRLHGREPWRQTEKEVAPSAKSVFQIGGAGAVGTGSLRGMPHLATLRDAGFSIWPFDPDGWPRVIEIYPRLLTQAVTKTRHGIRLTYLKEHFPEQPETLLERAAGSEDAFDAAVSALVMARHVSELEQLEQASPDSLYRREGRIWAPS